MTYTNDELVRLIRQRDQQAFAFLYDRYSQALFNVIIQLTGNTEEAEDILQVSFLKIWNNFSTFDEKKGRLYTWMLNIARHQAIDAMRSKQGKMRQKTNSPGNQHHLSKVPTEASAYDLFSFGNLLNVLGEEHRTIILLSYFEGFTQDEISRQLSIPLGTVKTRVRQALTRLREITEREVSG